MRRLEELLRQMCQAAKAIGNTELENKFAEGNNANNNYYFKDNEKFIPSSFGGMAGRTLRQLFN